MSEKIKMYGLFTITLLVLIGSLSVIGVLQTSERVSSSGIIIQAPLPDDPVNPPPNPPPSSPPEPNIEIGIYSDPGCIEQCTSITWGEIEVGSTITKTIYVMNAGGDSVYLFLNTDNWTPNGGNDYIFLSWDYDESILSIGMIKEITLSLSVSTSINSIDNFNFDIIITASVT